MAKNFCGLNVSTERNRIEKAPLPKDLLDWALKWYHVYDSSIVTLISGFVNGVVLPRVLT